MSEYKPRLTSKEAESLLLKNRFTLNRTKRSHRIYKEGERRMVIPFHASKVLHSKIIKELLNLIENK